MYGLLILTISFFTWGQTCPEKNLLTTEDTPFNKIPIYDQDGSGTCYAYAASVLANFYFLSKNNNSDLIVHPLAAALSHQNYLDSNSITGGSIENTLWSLKKYQFCNYKNIDAGLKKLASKYKMNDQQLIAYIETFYTIFRGNLATPENDNDDDEIKQDDKFDIHQRYIYSPTQDNTRISSDAKVKSHRFTAIQQAIKSTSKYMDPYTSCSMESLNDFGELLSHLNTTEDAKAFNKILNCKSRNSNDLPSHIKIEDYTSSFDSGITTKMRNHFNQSSQPLGISYCSTFLFNPSLDLIPGGESSKKPRGKLGDKCGMHASVLVGSRANAGKCEYLLRNSWGNGYWSNKFTCDCKHKKTRHYVKNCNQKNHPTTLYEVVGCWIPEESMSKNTFDLTWLE